MFHFLTGPAGPTHTVHEHPVEHLPDDETRHTHLDTFRNLAAGRTFHLCAVRYEAQC